MSERPKLLCTVVYFFYNRCLKWLGKYFRRRTLALFCSQSTWPCTWSWGGFGMQTGSDKWLDTYLSRRTLFFILTKGRQMKSGCYEVITYFVVASVHCAGAHDCLANKKRNNPSSFLPMDFWGYMSNLKMFSQSVTDWAIQVLDMLMHLKSKTQTNETAYNCATDILFHIVLNHHFKGGTDTFIGFISFTFLFGVFSNLSSNGLSEWMY